MCGRYFLAADGEAIARRFALRAVPEVAPRYNVAPGQRAWIIRREGEEVVATPMTWGFLPHWAKPDFRHRPINARAETVAQKPIFRDAWRRARRCLIPASGFYEWEQTLAGKMPWAIAAADGELLAMAGIWDEWHDAEANAHSSFAILTRPAEPPVDRLHERMPVLIPLHHQALWLSGAPAAAETLLALPNEVPLRMWRVSRRVNDAHHDEASLIEPMSASTASPG